MSGLTKKGLLYLVINAGEKRTYSIILSIITSLLIPFVVLNLLNVYLWNIAFNPIDFILKPFMIIPVAYLFITLFINGTSYVFNFIKDLGSNVYSIHLSVVKDKSKREAYSPVIYIMISIIIPFVVFNLLNVYLWNISFNPIDFILKPFMITPVAVLLLTLFLEWTRYAFNYARNLSLTIKKTNGTLSLRVVEKSLPIYIMDESYFNKDFKITDNTIVDMRVKDNNLSLNDHLNVVKLYNHDNQVNIPYLIDKAHQIIKDTAFKNKPITFIVDSKKERNRSISKIWLRLIRNPNARNANADIHTILELVY